MAVKVCPCCGQPILDRVDAAKFRAKLSPSERRLFSAIAAGNGLPVSISVIWNELWGLDPNGGPDAADALIRRFVCTSRPKVAPFGLGIECVRGIGYRLTTLAEAA